MELQIDQFRIITEHSMINSANEYEPGVLNTFLCKTGLKTQKFTKNV